MWWDEEGSLCCRAKQGDHTKLLTLGSRGLLSNLNKQPEWCQVQNLCFFFYLFMYLLFLREAYGALHLQNSWGKMPLAKRCPNAPAVRHKETPSFPPPLYLSRGTCSFHEWPSCLTEIQLFAKSFNNSSLNDTNKTRKPVVKNAEHGCAGRKCPHFAPFLSLSSCLLQKLALHLVIL